MKRIFCLVLVSLCFSGVALAKAPSSGGHAGGHPGSHPGPEGAASGSIGHRSSTGNGASDESTMGTPSANTGK